MTKVNRDPFSNGEDYRWWMSRNCDKCIKSSCLNFETGEFERKSRCSIFRDIEVRMLSDEPIAQRTIDICKKNDCPFRREHWKRHRRKSKTAGLPSLFKEEQL